MVSKRMTSAPSWASVEPAERGGDERRSFDDAQSREQLHAATQYGAT